MVLVNIKFNKSLAFFQLRTTITNIGEQLVCSNTQWSVEWTNTRPMVRLSPVRFPAGGSQLSDRRLSQLIDLESLSYSTRFKSF